MNTFREIVIKGEIYDLSPSGYCMQHGLNFGKLSEDLTNFDDMPFDDCAKIINQAAYGSIEYTNGPHGLPSKIKYFSLRKVMHPSFGSISQALTKDIAGEPSWINIPDNARVSSSLQ